MLVLNVGLVGAFDEGKEKVEVAVLNKYGEGALVRVPIVNGMYQKGLKYSIYCNKGKLRDEDFKKEFFDDYKENVDSIIKVAESFMAARKQSWEIQPL